MKKIRFICHFIRAACVLHNVALDDNFNVNMNNEPVEMEENFGLPDEDDVEDMAAGAIRDRVANALHM